MLYIGRVLQRFEKLTSRDEVDLVTTAATQPTPSLAAETN
jgi:hypothetical protein